MATCSQLREKRGSTSLRNSETRDAPDATDRAVELLFVYQELSAPLDTVLPRNSASATRAHALSLLWRELEQICKRRVALPRTQCVAGTSARDEKTEKSICNGRIVWKIYGFHERRCVCGLTTRGFEARSRRKTSVELNRRGVQSVGAMEFSPWDPSLGG